MAHELPDLSDGVDALVPHIDQRTMEIRHGKHHATDVTKLNGTLDGPPPNLQGKSVEELIGGLDALPKGVRAGVRNNGGGHATKRCSVSSWDLTSEADQPGPLPKRPTVPLEARLLSELPEPATRFHRWLVGCCELDRGQPPTRVREGRETGPAYGAVSPTS